MEQLAEEFENIQRSMGVQVFKTDRSFLTYQLSGDAVIIYDIYVKPEARNQNEAWRLFKSLIPVAQQLGKRVVIGFSEKIGKNKDLGVIAMQAAGFVRAHEDKLRTVFIKGI